MKLSDPFGRMARRQQQAYETMRDSLRAAGINTPERAREVILQARQRVIKFVLICLAVLLLVTAFAPNLWLLTTCFAIFLVVWATKAAVSGQGYVQRYIDEELP